MIAKVKGAQRLWNTRDPVRVAQAYTADSIWRNRDTFLKGTDEIVDFLTKKWRKEARYKCVSLSALYSRYKEKCRAELVICRLRKELFAWTDNKVAVQFWYEFFDEQEQSWFRCYGLGKFYLCS